MFASINFSQIKRPEGIQLTSFPGSHPSRQSPTNLARLPGRGSLPDPLFTTSVLPNGWAHSFPWGNQLAMPSARFGLCQGRVTQQPWSHKGGNRASTFRTKMAHSDTLTSNQEWPSHRVSLKEENKMEHGTLHSILDSGREWKIWWNLSEVCNLVAPVVMFIS